ncbi:hypothetical protein BUALT_Bualt13G0093900 [Buddleja alternifolia]|uniref:Fanconi-associated nuclease n=1 Tax=Buddleja alternifolia TaxID=168488 RepID=A0AAV6WX14_9LAMI|nr:hypothetical protein BUALT_Bualt13G0093900 [Buddleja alternifolia]
MLTGRQSLLRVVGRRRRFLPNCRSILSAAFPTSQSCLSVCQKGNNVNIDSVDKRSDDSGHVADMVNCPVCGARLPGHDDTIINSHLDKCLAKGSKRKLGQLTLLQLNFSRSKAKVHSSQSCDKGHHVIQSDPNLISSRNTINNSYESDSSGEYDKDQHYVALRHSPLASSVEIFSANDIANNKCALPPLLSAMERSTDVLEDCLDDCDISNVVVPTFIVGRRYGSRDELDPQARICLSRDPENVKDPNAIKVHYADCEYDNMLGYIPRELAQHLSPLMDKFHMNFEASITSAPKDSRAAVPIQIICKNVQLFDQNYCDNIQVLKSLWRHALRAAELAKNNPSGTIRYQHNLVLLIQEVLKSHPHLFTISEKSFLEAFNSLPDDSQRLFARIYTRKGPWFRMSHILYPEIVDCHQAMTGLLEAGYICSFPWTNELEDNDLDGILNVLNVDELRDALRVLNKKCNHGTRKQEIIDLLLSSSKDRLCSELQSFVLAITGSCVKVSPLAESLMWRAESGTPGAVTQLLLTSRALVLEKEVPVTGELSLLVRSDLLSYEEAIEISQIMDESLDENNSELVSRCIEISVSRMSICSGEGESSSGGSMGAFLSYFSASWIYSKVVLLGVSFLEREKRYIDAVNLLRELLKTFIADSRRGYWTLRLSVDLEHLGRLDDSLRVAEDGVLDPWVRAGSRVALQRRVLRLGKPPRRWKTPSYSKSVKRNILEVHVQGRPLNCKTGTKSIFYGEDGEQCGVEQLALQYYAGEGGGWQGVHAESGIWLTIFGILMWDIIFADVPNVFRTKFQTAPLDLETDSFYEGRKSLIEALMEKIEDGMAEEILITSWESHVGTSCRGVNWEKHSLADLRAVVKCIGGLCLASILRHLAQDYRSWSSGMPDLLLWRLHDCYRGEAKLVEVKGPRDRLSEQQRAWLLLLMDSGFSVEVCKVTPTPLVT